MALRWDFNHKGGTIKQERGGIHNWYEGNGLMIALNEWKEGESELYSMYFFFADKDHAKNCLGLSKGHSNIFEDDPITEITISRSECYQWKVIIDLFTKAFPEITIHVTV